ncbi:MAG: 1-deoxy-D-xylulose-5-phosphate reductoisomerase [Spirochaetia bacterium]|nr:1-deoxy-D-xylulose-5-phosphate reductoisomerase [Spirochaetia bacterium]
MKKKRVMILGCSGSIGTTALNMLLKHRDSFEVVAISAHNNIDSLISFAHILNVSHICLSGDDTLDSQVRGKTYWAHEAGLLDMIRNVDCDIVLNAISGSSGLLPTFTCIASHKDIALANKESIVMGGSLLFDYAKEMGVSIFPVDSEHSTLESLIGAYGIDSVSSLVITASGGPFRNHSEIELESVTLKDALKHPTWKMGAKITIDSATLANKGLEVIEASYLFNMDVEKIEVVIHPQSVVHSLIRMNNGAVYAQLSPPDMALPIMNALNNGHIELHDIVTPLDFSSLSLTFDSFDGKSFPLLNDAFRCAKMKGGYPIAFNGANEVAVEAFMGGRIPFHHISKVVHQVLQEDWSKGASTIDSIYVIDERVRTFTKNILSRWF